MTDEHRWPADFARLREGDGCPMCASARASAGAGAGDEAVEDEFGVRVFEGRWADGFLGRYPVRPGYAYVVWKGRHVCEPTELSAEESAGFWSEVARVAGAVDERYRPAKMNWLSLGNGVPHLHVHLVPRPDDDARAGGPVESEAFDRSRTPVLDDATLRSEGAALRAHLSDRPAD
ncbi:MAG TPA: HIT family protein [Acidimicrobiales bacterium]|nr:HIT family protein [Acidimicrobiales bacterium]